MPKSPPPSQHILLGSMRLICVAEEASVLSQRSNPKLHLAAAYGPSRVSTTKLVPLGSANSFGFERGQEHSPIRYIPPHSEERNQSDRLRSAIEPHMVACTEVCDCRSIYVFLLGIRTSAFLWRTINVGRSRDARHLNPPLWIKALFPLKSKREAIETSNALARRSRVVLLTKLSLRSILLMKSSERSTKSASRR